MREGGSDGSGIETTEKSTSGSLLDVREMEERQWHHCGFVLLFRSGGEVSELSGIGRIDSENEP